MNDLDLKRKQSFLLRLPVSVRETAGRLAHEEGTSLNHFIAMALAEKLTRMEASRTTAPPSRPNPSPYGLHRAA